MVLKDRSELPEVWTWIRDAAASNLDAQTCLLLVGHDVDALAASSMLTVRASTALARAIGCATVPCEPKTHLTPARAAAVGRRSSWRTSPCLTRQ